jgi:hypothetical protein
MLIEPKPGARLGLKGQSPMGDPLCHVKDTKELTSEDSPDRENYRSLPIRTVGRDNLCLYSQVEERDNHIPQADQKPSRVKRIHEKK